MPTVITTNSISTTTAYSNQRKDDRCQNGMLWMAFPHTASGSTASVWKFYYSADNGDTWTYASTSDVDGGSSSAHIPNGSFFIDIDDYAHLAYKHRTYGYLHYVRGTPNAARTAWTWSAATLLIQSEQYHLPDVVAHQEDTGWKVHVVTSFQYTSGGTPYSITRYSRIPIASDGTIGTPETNLADISAKHVSSLGTSPSIDFNHTGDGKTVEGGTPHLYVAWSAGATGAGNGIRFKKATYSAGSWTWGTEVEIDSARYVSDVSFWLNCLFDGTRVNIVGFLYDGAGHDLVLHERDAADTTTTQRVLLDNTTTTNALFYGSSTYGNDGDVYLFGRQQGAGDQPLNYRKWTRSTATLSAITTIDPSTVTPWISAKRGYSNNRIEFIYTDGSADPYNVTYGGITLNTPPNKPPIVAPKNNNVVDRNKTIILDWEFSDPDTGDSQSKFELLYRVAGTTTWTRVIASTTNTYHALSPGTLSANDYEWQVRTYDQAGEVSVWSDLAYFTAANPPTGHSITDPVVDQTIATEQYTVQWSASDQRRYELRRVADNGAGAPDTSNVLYTTGIVTSGTARSRTLEFPTNNQTEHIQLRYSDSTTLWSTWDTVRVNISYTGPPQPIVTVTPADELGYIVVSVNNPTPGAGQPSVNHNDIYRRRDGESRWVHRGANIGVNGYWHDHEVASGVNYQYQVRAQGDNGTSSTSDVQTGSLIVVHWRLKDPYGHTGFVISVEQDSLNISTPKDSSFFRPIGRKHRVAVEDVSRGDEFKLTMGVVDESDYTQLRDRLRELRTMLIQPPLFDELWYVRIKPGHSRDVLNVRDPYVKFDVDFVEVDEPDVPR